jgi:hypothetical protein
MPQKKQQQLETNKQKRRERKRREAREAQPLKMRQIAVEFTHTLQWTTRGSV